MKLSFTQINEFSECSEKFRIRRIEKIYPDTVGSALLFGSAIDETLNELLEYHRDNKGIPDYKATIDKAFLTVKDSQQRPLCPYVSLYVRYFKSDVQDFLLNDKDLDDIFSKATEYCISFPESVQEYIDGYDKANKNEVRLFNYIAWLSLKKKALLITESYIKEILPLIDEVIEVQTRISLPNEQGDEFNGVKDAVLRFKGETFSRVVDNKTASKPYEENSANVSEQLTIYSEHDNIRDVAFIVMSKLIRKKHPQVRIQIVKGKITDEQSKVVFNKIDDVFHKIKANVFHKKEFPKDCFSYGSRCDYYQRCWEGKV